MADSISDYLWRHGISPSPRFFEDWACENLDRLNKIEEQLNLVRGKLKNGKEKGIILKMLGTCLEAACHYKKHKEKEMRMLQDEVEQRKRQEMLLSLWIEQLQKHLGEEKEKQKRVEDKLELIITWAPNPPDPVKICKLIVSLENWDRDMWGDPDQEFSHESSEESELDELEFKVAPIIKTEVSIGHQGGNKRNTTQNILWDLLQLANLQEKYGRKPEKSETEYLWHVPLTGGDRTMLNQDEADSFWGWRVFLTGGPDSNNELHSITCGIAYWAVGIDPQEWGERTVIPTHSLSELSTAVTKAACVQAMNDRGEHGNYPVSAPIDPQAMKPLIW